MEKQQIFLNDPFTLLFEAFQQLYPDIEVECVWNYKEDIDGYGCTIFADDGTIRIEVAVELQIEDAVEVLAHELAHAVIGKTDNPHGEQWESVFEMLHYAYMKKTKELEEKFK